MSVSSVASSLHLRALLVGMKQFGFVCFALISCISFQSLQGALLEMVE